jgi:hypothetical protein
MSGDVTHWSMRVAGHAQISWAVVWLLFPVISGFLPLQAIFVSIAGVFHQVAARWVGAIFLSSSSVPLPDVLVQGQKLL